MWHSSSPLGYSPESSGSSRGPNLEMSQASTGCGIGEQAASCLCNRIPLTSKTRKCPRTWRRKRAERTRPGRKACHTSSVTPFTRSPRKNVSFMVMKTRSVLSDCWRYRDPSWQGVQMFYFLAGVTGTCTDAFVQTDQIVRPKWLYYTAGKLYLNTSDRKRQGPENVQDTTTMWGRGTVAFFWGQTLF